MISSPCFFEVMTQMTQGVGQVMEKPIRRRIWLRVTQMTANNVNSHARAHDACYGKLRHAASSVSPAKFSGPEFAVHTGGRLSLLALDLGTTTGWALRAPEGQIAHGFVSFKSQRFEGGGMRYLRFRRWLTDMKATVAGTQGIGAVYFEEVRRHIGVDAAHVYGGLLATLTAWCEHHQIPYQGVPVGTIKRHATGRGNASKDEVIAAMRTLGHGVTDDNEADALAILHWAIDTQEVV
jgi:crossover junction endodeoxyribonuclease RuvC